MINFFRKKRKKMADDNKILKYARYAIGEIVLVVVGILIALQVNNWNIEKHQNKEREELIISLINDFEASLTLIDSSLQFHDKVSSYTNFFINNIYIKKDYTQLDSLQKKFGRSFFNRDELKIITTTYKNAEASGKISILKDDRVLYLFSDFFSTKKSIESYNEIAIKMYYEGAIWELQKELGSIRILWEAYNNIETNQQEFLDLLLNPIVQSALVTKNVHNFNVKNQLDYIKNTTEEILVRLYCLKRDEQCD